MTRFLTREEVHNWVDTLFDDLEEHYEEEGVAVIGGFTGNVNIHAPSQSSDFYRIRGAVASPEWSFEGPGIQPGVGIDRAPSRGHTGLFGTLLVPRSDLTEPVQSALDGDEDAIEALQAGEVPADD